MLSKRRSSVFLYKMLLLGITIMAILFILRIISFQSSDSMTYLVVRLLCVAISFLLIVMNMRSRITYQPIVFWAGLYTLVTSVNIVFITRTSINDLSDAVGWALFFISSYMLQKKGILKIEDVFNYLDLTKIICVIASLGIVFMHLTGIIPGTSEMYPTYVLLALCPFALYQIDLNKRVKFNILFLVVTFIIMLMTSKRSCVLVIALGMVCYYFTKARIQSRNIRAIFNKIIKYVIVIILLFLIMYFFALQMGLDIIYRISDMLGGDTNGRSILWDNVLSAFFNSSFYAWLFGHGYHSFRFYQFAGYFTNLNGNLAHNDFLNTLYDYGFIGLFTYAVLTFNFIKMYFKLLKNKSVAVPSYAFSVVMLIIMSMVSYFCIESRIINFVAIYWGIILGTNFMENKKQIDKK